MGHFPGDQDPELGKLKVQFFSRDDCKADFDRMESAMKKGRNVEIDLEESFWTFGRIEADVVTEEDYPDAYERSRSFFPDERVIVAEVYGYRLGTFVDTQLEKARAEKEILFVALSSEGKFLLSETKQRL